MDFVSDLFQVEYEYGNGKRFLRSRDNMGEEANEERAQQIYEKSMKIETQFGDVLTCKY